MCVRECACMHREMYDNKRMPMDMDDETIRRSSGAVRPFVV